MSYAGDISCKECWNILQGNPNSQLIDVRTTAEWAFVGFPMLGSLNKELIRVEWQQYPAMQVNSGFATQVSTLLNNMGMDSDCELFTLCRSGVRSIAAAECLTAAGYTSVYNVLCGFEGNPDGAQHRGTVAGWKYDDLPWVQN